MILFPCPGGYNGNATIGNSGTVSGDARVLGNASIIGNATRNVGAISALKEEARKVLPVYVARLIPQDFVPETKPEKVPKEW